MYADDVVLYTEAMSNITSSENLQEGLDELSRWCEHWKMNINVKKCAVMRMTSHKCVMTPKYFLNNIELHVIQEFKYLGVTLSNKCNWQKHIQHVTSKGNQMLRFIKRNFKGCPKRSRKQCTHL